MTHTHMDAEAAERSDHDPLRVPFWIVLAGVGAGAFWALAGVALGAAVARGRDGGHRPPRRTGRR